MLFTLLKSFTNSSLSDFLLSTYKTVGFDITWVARVFKKDYLPWLNP
jgi:hypothetical protein